MGSRSVIADAERLVSLRRQVGWTQSQLATKAGYSVRLIRKIETQQPVRPQSLRDVVQCYFTALGYPPWELDRFIAASLGDCTVHAVGIASQAKADYSDVVCDFYEVIYQQRQPNRIGDYVDPAVRFTSEGQLRIGIGAIQQRVKTLLAAFDSIEFNVVRSVVEDSIAVVSWNIRMCHVGRFFGVPPTKKFVNVSGTTVAEFDGGLIVKSEEQLDVANLVRQLKDQDQIVI